MNRFVKINPARGFGDDVWEVIKTHGSGSRTEVDLKTAIGRTVRIYQGHCYPARVSEIEAAFEQLSAEERIEIYSTLKSRFCVGCGNPHPSETRRCQCWNDE